MLSSFLGGGRGTGLEPSPCNPAQWKATQRTASITALPRLAQWQPKPARGGHLALPNNQNTATVKSGLARSYLMALSAFVARPEGAPRSGETRCRRMAGRNAGANIGRATSLALINRRHRSSAASWSHAAGIAARADAVPAEPGARTDRGRSSTLIPRGR
jgi:hypothetical protein